ncbi:protamine-like protein (modular protein) [Burkholderia diffusa]|nr:protamine-like protein (modular protein) [Burkholderia diffusa]
MSGRSPNRAARAPYAPRRFDQEKSDDNGQTVAHAGAHCRRPRPFGRRAGAGRNGRRHAGKRSRADDRRR